MVKYDIGLMDGLEQRVSVNVYNVVGQHVTTLASNVSQVGHYVKDGDKFGVPLPSGIYFVQLNRLDNQEIKMMFQMIIYNLIKTLDLVSSPFLLFLTNCRQPVIPTEEDLAGYG